MDLMNLRSTDWVTCPYDPVHQMKYSKFHNHFVKCKRNHPDDPRKQCPYNASELVHPKDYDNHLIRCPYKVLFSNHGPPNADLQQYDAPCDIKFGHTSRPLRKIEVKMSNEYRDMDDEIDSVSVIGRSKDLDDSYESDDDFINDEISWSIKLTEERIKTSADDYIFTPSTNAKSQMGDDFPSRNDGYLEKLQVLIPKRGFGRGALYNKLGSPRNNLLDANLNVSCPKEQNGNEIVTAQPQERHTNGSQNGTSPAPPELEYDEITFNRMKFGRGRGAIFRYLSKK